MPLPSAPTSPFAPLPLEVLPPLPPLQLAVVGHVEVVTFLEVDNLPAPGEIQTARGCLEVAAGGGAVVAVQLARLLGAPVAFFSALGRDGAGERAGAELAALGLDLHIAWRDAPTRRGVTFVDGSGERTITVIGERLNPMGADALPWDDLGRCDGVFVTAADPEALRLSRAARLLAATPRVRLPLLNQAGVALDALIGSGLDPAERVDPGALVPAPGLRIATAGAAGGEAWPFGPFAAPPRRRPVLDAYGAGDSFAAGVTAGLAAGWSVAEAISLGCHCGNACLDGRGPYGGQLRRSPAGGLEPPG